LTPVILDEQWSGFLFNQWEGAMSVIFVRKAQALPGKEFEAVKWGLEIAKLSSEIMGVEVMVGQQVGGPIGLVGWRATHANMGAFEAAMNKLLTNEKFAKNVAEHVPHLFVPGSGRDEIWNVLS
jgi:hypothetical protein